MPAVGRYTPAKLTQTPYGWSNNNGSDGSTWVKNSATNYDASWKPSSPPMLPSIQSGWWYDQRVGPVTPGNTALTAAWSYFFPYYWPQTFPINALGLATSASGTGWVGLYQYLDAYTVGRAVVSPVGMALSATGTVSAALPVAQTVQQGWYWWGVSNSANTGNFYSVPPGNVRTGWHFGPAGSAPNAANTGATALYDTALGGILTDAAPTIVGQVQLAGGHPLVFYRVAS